MTASFSDPGFWGVFCTCLVMGCIMLLKWAAHGNGWTGGWGVCCYIGILLVLVGFGLPVYAFFASRPEPVTLASPEPEVMKIRIIVETAPSLPDIGERVIVNPEPARDLVEQWEILPQGEKQEKLEELLDEPDTRVWTKPAGLDEPNWYLWKDLPAEDRLSVLERIPDLTPLYEF